MPQEQESRIKIQPVRKSKPDVRALARVLIELALRDASAPTGESDPAENVDNGGPSTGVETPA